MKRVLIFMALVGALCSCGNSGNSGNPNGTNSSSQNDKINGHEYVDLGLPSGLKWATCNVGATSVGEYGEYFALGELTPTTYANSLYVSPVHYVGNISGNPQYDVARAKWGASWRMPSLDEFVELLEKCQWEWTSKSGHKGYKVVGPNGNSIFLPAAGYYKEDGLWYSECRGHYWSATGDSESVEEYGYTSFMELRFDQKAQRIDRRSNYIPHPIRPVSD